MPRFRRRPGGPGRASAPGDPAVTQPLPASAREDVYEEIPVEAEPRPPRLWPWLLALLVLVAAGLGALYGLTRDGEDPAAAPGTTAPEGRVLVPDVTGDSLDEATARLVDAGLRADPVERATDGPPEVVLTQSPEPGRQVERGTAVELTFAGAAGAVTVPDVIGLSAARAFEVLDKASLAPKSRRVFAAAPVGDVVSQDPAAGEKVERDTEVILRVSRGRRSVEVPDIVGLSESEASAALEDAGLEVGVGRVPSGEPAGTVVAQSPAAGEREERGATVQINVSRGPGTTTSAATAAVPDVVGLTRAEAVGQLRAAGFGAAVKQVPSAEPRGVVVAQAPAGGERATAGRTVQINVSGGQAAVVPDVVGDDEETATRRLERAGFTVEVETGETDDPSEDGIVIEQRPAGGKQARRGAVVTVVVGVLSG